MDNRVIKICILFTCILKILPYNIYSQADYINLNTENILRYEKKFYDNNQYHSGIRPFLKSDIHASDSLSENVDFKITKRFYSFLLNSNFIEKNHKAFTIYANPILSVAPEISTNPKESYQNFQAGITIGGEAGKKFAFRFDGLYGIQTFYHQFDSKIDSGKQIPYFGNSLSKNGPDYGYTSLTGYLSYNPWKYLNLQSGIGSNFWGEGYRSLFLSDNTTRYPFFKVSVNVWKIKYIWLFGYLQDFNSELNSQELKSKLLFSHYLSWNATNWLNINFFESIVSNPVDSMGITYFNVGYLNPVIFFRPVEFSGGSADNALLGFGFKIKLWKKYQIYTQMVIDEFVWSELKSGSGWWGNKFGLQGGLKIFDPFNLKNLFVQMEYNAVRPYTFSYSNSILNYGNHFYPLAHPSGANFKEFVFISHYHSKRFSAMLKAIISSAGMDSDSINYGHNTYKSTNQRASDYGNAFLQGYKGNFSSVELKISWILNPKLNHLVFASIKKQKIEYPGLNLNNTYLSLGLKYLLWNNDLDYLQLND